MRFTQEELELTLNQLNPEITKTINLQIYENISSTNQKLWELIDLGIDLPTVIIALAQTAGRGQRGRIWESPSGGLYLSLGISTSISSQNAAHLTILSGCGIAQALKQHQLPVWLKWPNDLLLQGRKLGGIKCETRIYQERINYGVIGVGINWCNQTPEVGINLESYYAQQQLQNTIPSLESLAAIAIYGLLSAYKDYCEQGIEYLMPKYLKLLDTQGRKVMVNGCSGIVTGVTEQGELKVRLEATGARTEICFPIGTISVGYD